MDIDAEKLLRQRVMNRLDTLVEERGFVTRQQLSDLIVDGRSHRLVDTTRGIRNPKELSATLAVISDPDGPYDDRELDGALFRYSYQRGTEEGSNRKLRRALDLALPIILLRKQREGYFVPIYPVYVIGDDRPARQFIFALNELVDGMGTSGSPLERRYVERLVKQRLHQAEFRGRVLHAYETQCAVCNLKFGRLLEAAHIVADRESLGDPIVSNGLSLCKIHHAAYDADLLGITPRYIVQINHSLLEAVDGPMLRHGLQEMHQRALTLPRTSAERPDPDRLASRWDAFQAAG